MRKQYLIKGLEKYYLFQLVIQFVLYLASAFFLGIYLKRSSYELIETLGLNNNLIHYYITPQILCIGFLSYFLLKRLNTVLPWKKYLIARFFSGYLLTYFFTLLFFTISFFLIIRLSTAHTIENFQTIIDSEVILKILTLSGIALLIYNLVYFYIYSLGYYYNKTLEIQKLKRQQIDLHINALKNQLTPHFLFNNLNTISSLLYTDKHNAVDYVHRFADICNFIINNNNNLLISLKDELNFVGNYVSLMNIRFNNLITLNYSIPSNIQIKNFFLPPLSVQLLVENAIKHNKLKEPSPLIIDISIIDNKYLTVENEKTGIPEFKNLGENVIYDTINKEVSGKGLSNLKLRYLLLSGKRISVKSGKSFCVKIPLLNNTILNK